MRAYRIAKAKYPSLDGEGARLYGGRWNNKGVAIAYLSTSIALALVENLVHFELGMMPPEMILITVEIPNDITTESLETLPDDWNSPDDAPGCRAAGDEWVRSMHSALLLVPSVIVPKEYNILLNPSHPDSTRLTINTEPFPIDPRLHRSRPG